MNALTGLVHSMTTGPPPINSPPALRPLEGIRRIPLGPGSTPAVPDSAWCSDSFMLGAGMVIIQEHTHKIVVVYDSHRKRWFFPRGRKDVGESVEQAALREAYEEVCDLPSPSGISCSTCSGGNPVRLRTIPFPSFWTLSCASTAYDGSAFSWSLV